MPRPEHIASGTPVTRPQLEADLRRLGVPPDVPLMVHASLSAIGWVVGGVQTVLEALLAVAGPHGTVCAQASWEDIPFGLASWPPAWRRAYRTGMPAFDPQVSAAAHYEGRLAERIRTWPGAERSANPATGLVAVGHHARTLTAGHRLDDGFGAGTPYGRLVALGGQVLLLGAPLKRVSLLHHAEALARAPKRWTTYEVPLRDGWRAIREIDVWGGVFPYDEPEPLAALVRGAQAAGVGTTGEVGGATAHRLPGAPLVAHAVAVLERRFGSA